MKSKKIVLWLSVVLVIMIVGAYLGYSALRDRVESQQLRVESSSANTPQQTAQPPKELAPDFTAYTEDGKTVKLSDYRGKPVVLNFWASWCGPCKSEMPEFNQAAQTYADSLVFLMVNMTDGQRETLEIAREYVKEQGFTFPVVYDTESNAAMTYQVYSLPTTYFIDKDGYPIAQVAGAIDGATLQKGIDMIIS